MGRVFAVILVLILALPVQATCPMSYVGCAACPGISLCTDYPSGLVWYFGDNPEAMCMGRSWACIWCTYGCAWCLSVYMVVAAECDGLVNTYSGDLCCRDYFCCYL
jgi:hypothetical protein